MKLLHFLFLTSTLSTHLTAVEVSILFRSLTSPREVYQFVLSGGQGWPSIEPLADKWGRAPYRSLAPAQVTELNRTVFAHPRSWGHVAIEFRDEKSLTYWGWVPVASSEQMSALANHLVNPRTRTSRISPLLPGRFIDAGPWVNDQSHISPLRRIRLPDITPFEAALARIAVAQMNESDLHYQLTPSGQRPLDPGCENCATAVKQVLLRAGFDLDFIPPSGSITVMWSLVSEKANLPRLSSPCSFSLRRAGATLLLNVDAQSSAPF